MRRAALVLGSALLLAGCGSTRLSQHAFSQRAGRICGDEDRALFQPSGPGSPVTFGSLVSAVATLSGKTGVVETATARLHALRPPRTAEPRFRRYLALRDDELGHLHAMVRSWRTADRVRSVQALRAYYRVSDRADTIAESFHWSCSSY